MKWGKMMEKRKVLSIVQLIVPAIVMFVLAYFAFAAADDLYTTGLILNALIIYFPLLFLLQGIVCASVRGNIFVSLGVSVVAYIIVIFVWLNSSAAVYVIAYVVVWFIAYGVARIIQNMRQ